MNTAEPTYEGALYAGRRLRIEAACDQVPATIYAHRAVIGAFPHTPRPFAEKTSLSNPCRRASRGVRRLRGADPNPPGRGACRIPTILSRCETRPQARNYQRLRQNGGAVRR